MSKEIKSILSNVLYITAVLLFSFLIVRYVGQRTEVIGSSMVPTLEDGNQLITDKITYRFREPERFDIIVFPHGPAKEYYIKRIIGMPGDTVEFRDGDVYINNSDTPLSDAFCSVQDMTGLDMNRTVLSNPFTVPEDCYFVLGDNRLNSKDSRYWQNPFVQRDKILGEAMFRYWPLNTITVIRSYSDAE